MQRRGIFAIAQWAHGGVFAHDPWDVLPPALKDLNIFESRGPRIWKPDCKCFLHSFIEPESLGSQCHCLLAVILKGPFWKRHLERKIICEQEFLFKNQMVQVRAEGWLRPEKAVYGPLNHRLHLSGSLANNRYSAEVLASQDPKSIALTSRTSLGEVDHFEKSQQSNRQVKSWRTVWWTARNCNVSFSKWTGYGDAEE